MKVDPTDGTLYAVLGLLPKASRDGDFEWIRESRLSDYDILDLFDDNPIDMSLLGEHPRPSGWFKPFL